MKNPILLSLSSLILLGACQGLQPQSIPTQSLSVQSSTSAQISGEIVIQYKSPLNAQNLNGKLKSLGLQTLKVLAPGLVLAKHPVQAKSINVLQTLNANPEIAYAEPNFKESLLPAVNEPNLPGLSPTASFPNDPMYSQQYAHKVSNSQAGWKQSKGSEKITIAVVDTGVDLKHPDLKAKLVAGYDFIDNDALADDGHGHGTHCAGIAAAITNNEVGVAGFSPGAKIMPVRVLNSGGSGSSAGVAQGVRWAADNGAQVISMSLGSRSDAKVKADAIRYALSKDVVVVAAMGNYGNNSKIYPAAQKGVVSVGSTDKRDKKSSFSQYGIWINVTAPGSAILSTWPTQRVNGKKDYGTISGTSMATPAVAGVVAEIRAKFPSMNVAEVTAQLEQGTDDLGEKGYDHFYGHGRINLAKALTRQTF